MRYPQVFQALMKAPASFQTQPIEVRDDYEFVRVVVSTEEGAVE